MTGATTRPGGAATPADISVIMPVYNGAAFLARSLPPLQAMLARGDIAELIVVDDGSTDDSAALAHAAQARVIASGGRLGPGAARNLAALEAAGAILWFVDADVVVRADAAVRIGARFGADAGGAPLAALFGSYDDVPAAPNFCSQYKNLAHHHQHQRSAGPSASFWAGCGAVRSSVFAAVGGFDGVRFAVPSIEDIELGGRMAAQGWPILLDPAIQCTHLKVWRLGELLATDIFRRAVPWSRLILERGGLRDELNVRRSERWRAVLALLLLFSLLTPAYAPLLPALLPVLLLSAAAIGANHRLFGVFRRHNGAAFALAAIGFHQVVYAYSSAAFACCWLTHHAGRGTRPGCSA